MGKRVAGLDSLRWFAAMLVVMSHTRILLQGGLGNAIFFTLSGFLAISPFKANGEQQFLRLRNIGKYYLSRIVRVMLTLWFCLLLVWALFPYNQLVFRDFDVYNNLFLNMSMIKVHGHLWFLQQEMFYYLLVPFLMIGLNMLRKFFERWNKMNDQYYSIIAVILFTATFICDHYNSSSVFYLLGNGGKQMFRIQQFLLGMGFGYIYKAMREKGTDFRKIKWYQRLSGLYGFAFVVFCICSSSVVLALINERYADWHIGWAKPMLCGVLTGIMIIFLLTGEESLFHRAFCNKVFAFLGRISFPVYIMHWYFIPIFGQQTAIRNFLLLYIVTNAIAVGIHFLVEKPAIVFSKSFSIADVKKYYCQLADKNS